MNGRRIRLAYVIDGLGHGGVQSELIHIAAGLARRGYEQRVYGLSDWVDPEVPESLEASGVEVTVIGKKALLTLVGPLRIIRDFRRWRPDVVQTFLWYGNVLGRTLARAAGIRAVVSSIQNRNVDQNRIQFLFERVTMPWAGKVTFNSNEVVPFSIRHEGVRESQVVYIPNGVAVPEAVSPEARERIRAELATKDGDRLLGMVGRLYPQKNHVGLITAFAAIQTRLNPRTTLIIVGDGPLRGELQARASELGVADRIRFLGRRTDIWKILAALDVYVHSSLWEGMPNAVMEAMAAGCPVVATDVDGNRELITDGETGWLVPPGDPVALAGAILRVIEDPVAAGRVGQSAARRMAGEFSVERMVDGYDRLYKELA